LKNVFTRLLRVHSSFFTYFLDFFEFSKNSKFKLKNYRFLISDPDKFQKIRPNFLTVIVNKYLDIFARESTAKQLSHLHYKNFHILRIVAPQFCFDFS
jgi:hypothetical protein